MPYKFNPFTGRLDIVDSGGGTPGGADTQIQYNNAGAFGGITGVTSDGSSVSFGDDTPIKWDNSNVSLSWDTTSIPGEEFLYLTSTNPTDSIYFINLVNVTTSVSGVGVLLNSSFIVNPSANTNSSYYNLFYSVSNSGAANDITTGGVMAGIGGSAQVAEAGRSVDQAVGVIGNVDLQAGSSVTIASHKASLSLSGGSTTQAIGYWVESTSGTGATTAWGLKVDSIAAGVTNWGIGVGNTPSYFEGNLALGTTTVPNEKLMISGDTVISGHSIQGNGWSLGSDTASATNVSYIKETFTPSSGLVVGLRSEITSNPSANATSVLSLAFSGVSDATDSSNFSTIGGIQGFASHSGGGTATNIVGGVFDGVQAGAGTGTFLYSTIHRLSLTGAGNVGDGYHIYIPSMTDTGAGSVTGSLSGLYIEPVTAGVTNYAFKYNNSTNSVYILGTGELSLGDSTPSARFQVTQPASSAASPQIALFEGGAHTGQTNGITDIAFDLDRRITYTTFPAFPDAYTGINISSAKLFSSSLGNIIATGMALSIPETDSGSTGFVDISIGLAVTQPFDGDQTVSARQADSALIVMQGLPDGVSYASNIRRHAVRVTPFDAVSLGNQTNTVEDISGVSIASYSIRAETNTVTLDGIVAALYIEDAPTLDSSPGNTAVFATGTESYQIWANGSRPVRLDGPLRLSVNGFTSPVTTNTEHEIYFDGSSSTVFNIPSADSFVWSEAGTTIAELDSSSMTFTQRVLMRQGADVASANDLALGTDGNTFEITGTTQINAIITTGWQNGSVVILLFSDTLTVKHNTAGGAGTVPILLAGSVDFSTSAGDTLMLVLSEIGGTQAWREVARTII